MNSCETDSRDAKRLRAIELIERWKIEDQDLSENQLIKHRDVLESIDRNRPSERKLFEHVLSIENDFPNRNPLDFVQADRVVPAVVKLRRPRALVVGHLLSLFQRATVREIIRDSGRTERVATNG
jgi:hypothetical protein